MGKTILLTGATGFIGSQVLEQALKIGYIICAVIRPQSDLWRIKHLLANPCLKVYGNKKEDIEKIFLEQKIDCVVHLAAKYLKQHNSVAEVEELINANVVFSAMLLETMRQHAVRSIVTAGSFFEYDLSGNKELSENSALKPYNLYARTKLILHDMLKDYADWFGFSCIHLRLFSTYGPKDNEKLFSYLINNLLKKQKIQLTPSKQEWNFTYVSDVVDAFILAIERCVSIKAGCEVYNIGQKKAVSIKNIVKIIENQLAISGLVSYDKPYSANEVFYVSCSSKKTKKDLGWAAKIDIEEGLRKTLDFYISKL